MLMLELIFSIIFPLRCCHNDQRKPTDGEPIWDQLGVQPHIQPTYVSSINSDLSFRRVAGSRLQNNL